MRAGPARPAQRASRVRTRHPNPGQRRVQGGARQLAEEHIRRRVRVVLGIGSAAKGLSRTTGNPTGRTCGWEPRQCMASLPMHSPLSMNPPLAHGPSVSSLSEMMQAYFVRWYRLRRTRSQSRLKSPTRCRRRRRCRHCPLPPERHCFMAPSSPPTDGGCAPLCSSRCRRWTSMGWRTR
jgi:hypothetical protein